MIYPEDDEYDTTSNYYSIEYPYNISSIQYRSPTLPLHFDKKYLPRKNLPNQAISARRKSSRPANVCSSTICTRASKTKCAI